MTRRSVSILGVAPILVICAACASFPPPTNDVANALASIRGAEELGAVQVPQAALQLQLADEALKQARRLMTDGQNERAHYKAVRAANDAELAIALTREAHATKLAEEAKQQLEASKTPEVKP